MIEKSELGERIKRLKKEKNAVILAHNYQRGNVQDVADFTGDSFGLSKKAVDTEADMIVFSGVRFMAETASILNPDKKVLLPDPHANCALAEMCTIKELKKECMTIIINMDWIISVPDTSMTIIYISIIMSFLIILQMCW